MDRGQFDALTRLIAAQRSRRSAIAVLLGVTVLGPLSSSVAARRKGNDGNRRDGGKRSSKRKAKDKTKGNDKSKRRTAQDRKARNTAAAATRCCNTGNCTPGKGKNLQKCCYQGQNLTGRNFQGANLGSANFSGATLTGVNLHSANLSQACLVDADLRGAKSTRSTNLTGAIYCRTKTDSGENNSGCDRGTACCPTCDADHPCGTDHVCCNGRCIAGDCCANGAQSTCGDGGICCDNICVQGDCCAAADCPNEICQRRSCQDHRCTYAPVTGEPGPRCQTICCEDAQGDPVCCDTGIEFCQPNGRCGCDRDADCDTDQKCCAGICVDRSTCCEGNNAEGCDGNLHCCVSDGDGVCRACCDADQCPDETCQTKRCGASGTCAYIPVFGDDGPGCATICCENANDTPVCCPDGTTVCQTNRLCGCRGNQDCAASELCCNGTCIANTQCCNNDPSTCPAPGICQQRACNGNQCQPEAVTGGTCLFASGGTGECRNGSCICPSPRITCSNGCCPPGVAACKMDGTCQPGCDVCPSGCPFTTLKDAVAGTPANGTIRICPGTYPTNSVIMSQKNLTIVGAGSGSDPATDTILTGGNTSGVLSIFAATVTIQDLTVTDGKGADRSGGIEVAFDATLNLERVEVVGNTSNVSPTGPNSGGGLFVDAGSTAVIKASRIANNTTQGGPSAVGGGIFNDGTLTLEATRVEGNIALSGSGITNSRDARLTLNQGAVVTMNTANNPSLPLGSGIYNLGTIIDNDTGTNVFGNFPSTFNGIPNNCVNELPGIGCPA